MSIQKATGNMYEWVDYVHSYLRGECPYQCPYCYVRAIAQRFDNKALQGPLHFAEQELKANYNAEKYNGKTIFVEHTHDLWNDQIGDHIINLILATCDMVSAKTRFVFQTRNTPRASWFWQRLPEESMIGTTIETNRPIGNAPDTRKRAYGLYDLRYSTANIKTFVTIEPILKFDLDEMITLLDIAEPNFINIGADSKGTGLEEPTAQEIRDLIAAIQDLGIEIRTKRNLDRILNPRKKKGTPCPSK